MNERSPLNPETAVSGSTRRTRQAQQTRARLVDTALELFSRQGFEATSIRQIAQEAGVAQGLLYNYFPSKEELFWGILETYSFVPHLQEILQDAADRPAAEVLREAAEKFHRFLAEREPLMRLIIGQAQTRSEVAEVWARYLREEAKSFHQYLQARIDSGELRPHDTEVTLRMLMSPIIVLHAMGATNQVDPQHFIDGLVDTLLNGIMA